ncbi:MAG: hypothetical protein NTW87_14565 [Planctomycetota bacterium]|nr:hypothetical protein [Planctomycetota bacterium]
MNWFTTSVALLATLAGTQMTRAGEGTDADSVLIKDFEALSDFTPNKDGGTPPQFSLDKEHFKQGQHGLRVAYKHGTPGYGNLSTPAVVRDFVEAVSVQVYKESAAPKAALHLWFFEADGDGWLSKPIVLEELKDGWNYVRVPLAEFRFEKRGDGKPDLAQVNRMLIGCNYGDFTVVLDDLRYEGKDIRRKWANLEKAQTMVTILADKPVVGSFMGFGAEWDPKFWTQGTFKTKDDAKIEVSVTEQDWELVVKRIRWMKLPIVRMMMMTRWCTEGDGKFNWQTKHMQSLYRHLDVCQKEGITVLLTDWGCVPEWTRVPGINGVGDPKYAEAIGTYLDYLLNQKNYSCIQYFILVNEPNYEAGGYENWRKGVQNIAKALEERKLNAKVALVGSDAAHDDGWHRNAVDHLQGILGGYDIHRYASVDEVRSGGTQRHYQTQWAYALAKDPNAKAKPLIVAEAGISAPGFSASNNSLHLTYEYGLYMADYAAQATNAGSWAVLAWMLDDSSHEGFTWGMWKNKAGKFELKPWFYTWSLLTRYFPRGSQVATVECGLPDLRVLAARVPGKNGGAWSILLVNRASAARKVQLTLAGAGKMAFQRYVYSRAEAKADADGFPVPVGKEELDLGQGAEVSVPGESVVLLTSGD